MGGYNDAEFKECLETDWITTFDKTKGACYTFDPSRLNLTFVPVTKTYLGTEEQLAFFEVTLKYEELTGHNDPPTYTVTVHDTISDRFDVYKVKHQ